MAYVQADRVAESTTTTGTGALTVSGALPGFQAFGDVMSVGDTAHCMVWAVDASGNATGDYQGGLYTYSGANTLTLTEFIESSTGSVLTLAAGTSGLAQYARDQFANQALDVVAEFTAMRAAMVSLRNWINTNFPRDAATQAVLTHTYDVDGVPTLLTFSTVQLDALRTQIATFAATVG